MKFKLLQQLKTKREETLNEAHGDIELEGYVLSQYEEVEPDGDNAKIWHEVTDPSGKRDTLQHTPYEWLTKEDFAHYVEYHKKHGQWPGRRPTRGGTANWDQDSIRQMNRRLSPFHADKLNRFVNSEQEEEKDVYVRPDGKKFTKPDCIRDCRCNWCMGLYDHLKVEKKKK